MYSPSAAKCTVSAPDCALGYLLAKFAGGICAVHASSLDFNDEPVIQCAKGCMHGLVRVRARKQRVMKSGRNRLCSTTFANVKSIGGHD